MDETLTHMTEAVGELLYKNSLAQSTNSFFHICPQIYKTVFLLNSTEHEISTALKTEILKKIKNFPLLNTLNLLGSAVA